MRLLVVSDSHGRNMDTAISMISMTIVLSSIFPRTSGPFMDGERKKSYNAMVKDFGDKLEAACGLMRVRYMKNEVLWSSKEEGRAHPVFFIADGLHLSAIGREAVARGWMDEVVRV
jgi:hypothetical protein